jgi:uncharacterized protein
VESDEVLADVDTAESELRRLGFPHLQVRDCAGAAWIEVSYPQLELIAHDPLRSEVVRAVRAAGFLRVALAIDGE